MGIIVIPIELVKKKEANLKRVADEAIERWEAIIIMKVKKHHEKRSLGLVIL